MNKIYGIQNLKEDGVYEIHPTNSEKVSGTIKVIDGKLYNDGFLMGEQLIDSIETVEEEHPCYYVKIK